MSKLLPYETIVKAHEGDPEAVNAVLRHYAGYIRYFSKVNGQVNAYALRSGALADDHCDRFHPRTISRETVPMYREPLEVSRGEETHRDRRSLRKNERTNAVFAQKGLPMQILNSSCGTTANGVWDIHEGDEAYLEGV